MSSTSRGRTPASSPPSRTNPLRGVVAALPVAKSSTLAAPDVEACITSAVRTWRFAPPANGGIQIVTYPFTLKQMSDEPAKPVTPR